MEPPSTSEEETSPPPCPSKEKEPSLPWFSQPIPHRSLIVHLLFISFGTGLLDAPTYHGYGVFASNQTGNTIIILTEAINAAGSARRSQGTVTEGAILLAVGVSLSSFLIFGGLFGQLANVLGRCKRSWLAFSTLIQAIFLFIPAILLQLNVLNVAKEASSQDGEYKSSWIILLLGGSAGIQLSMAKSVGIPEIPSAVLTSSYADLLTDPHLFHRSINSPLVRPRNLRLAYIFSIVAGTLVGAAVQLTKGTAATVWFAWALRMVNLVYILVVKPGKEPGEGKASRQEKAEEKELQTPAGQQDRRRWIGEEERAL